MTHDQSSLDELFHRARDFGSPDAQAIVRAWDAETDLRPLETIELANSEDLREELKDIGEDNDKLEGQVSALKYALGELRCHVFGVSRRVSQEFSDDYDFYQGDAAKEAAAEYAPDLYVQCVYVLVEDGELSEIWVSESYINDAFDRVY